MMDWVTNRVPTEEECGKYGRDFLVTVLTNKPTVLVMRFEYIMVKNKKVGRWLWNGRVNIPWNIEAWKPLPVPYRG